MTELESRIAELEAFEATPAGAALKKYRDKMQTAILAEGVEDAVPSEHWTEVRKADRVLIAEIKALQSEPLRKRPIAWMRYVAEVGAPPAQFRYRSDDGDPPEEEGWIALYRRGGA